MQCKRTTDEQMNNVDSNTSDILIEKSTLFLLRNENFRIDDRDAIAHHHVHAKNARQQTQLKKGLEKKIHQTSSPTRQLEKIE